MLTQEAGRNGDDLSPDFSCLIKGVGKAGIATEQNVITEMLPGMCPLSNCTSLPFQNNCILVPFGAV